jgi:hypothetical protein
VTAYDEKLAAAIAAKGVPLSADLVAPQSTLRDRMAALVERQKRDAAVARLRLLLAEQPHQLAAPGELAEYRHLLYDADADATVPAFPYPTTPKGAM